MTSRRLPPHRALLFAGPRDGEEAVLEIVDDDWPERIPNDCGYYRLDVVGRLRRRPVYRWVPPEPNSNPPGTAQGLPG